MNINPTPADIREYYQREGVKLAGKANGDWQPIHCLRGDAHSHGDRIASAAYSIKSGYIECKGCGLKGRIEDLYPDLGLQRPCWMNGDGSPLCGDTRKLQYWERIYSETVALDHEAAEPGRLYLKNRGLSLSTFPTDVRFHSSLPFFKGDGSKEIVGTCPVLVALVRDSNGKPKAIQRTYLTHEGSKAAVPEPKKSCGPISGGAVLLSPATDSANVAEGLETAWSVWEATGQATCAVLGTSGMKAFEICTSIKTLDVWADHDANGAGELAAKELLTKAHRLGLGCRNSACFEPCWIPGFWYLFA
jgi:hypothetical protein